MKAKISGMVMEILTKKTRDEKQEEYKTAMVYQPGEKELLEVKGINGEVEVGQKLEDVPVQLFPWTYKGKVGMACKLLVS